jgi:hypothetical protein
VVTDRVERLVLGVVAVLEQLRVEDLLFGEGVDVEPGRQRRPDRRQLEGIRRGPALQLVEGRELPPEPRVVIQDQRRDVGHGPGPWNRLPPRAPVGLNVSGQDTQREATNCGGDPAVAGPRW